jgi:hypothetical protein
MQSKTGVGRPRLASLAHRESVRDPKQRRLSFAVICVPGESTPRHAELDESIRLGSSMTRISSATSSGGSSSSAATPAAPIHDANVDTFVLSDTEEDEVRIMEPVAEMLVLV